MRVLESLLRYDPPDRDISWMRMPILFVGLIVVFGFQIGELAVGIPMLLAVAGGLVALALWARRVDGAQA